MGALQEIRHLLHRRPTEPVRLPGSDIRIPSAAELEERAEQRRHAAHGETLSPTVAFVLSWEDRKSEPGEQIVPAWESRDGKLYTADLPAWLNPRVERLMRRKLDGSMTAYYEVEEARLSVTSTPITHKDPPYLQTNLHYKSAFERFGIVLNMRGLLPDINSEVK